MSSRIAINNSPDIQMQSHHTVTAARVRVSMLRRNGWSFRIGRAMPSETDTSKRSSITCVAVPHCQMQRNHAVAAGGVRERVRRCNSRCRCISLAIPCKAITCGRCRVARVTVPHGQVQGHHAVTAAGIRERMRQGFRAGGDACMLVPVKTIACKRRGIARTAVIHSQVQRHHAVTAARVRERVRRSNGWSLRIGCAVPCETVAGNRCRVACIAVIHSQVQSHHTVTA